MPEAVLLDGAALAAALRENIRREAAALAARGVPCALRVLLAGNDAASEVYVRNKQRDCAAVGIDCQLQRFDEQVTQAQLLAAVHAANADAALSGILVQLPLPRHINAAAVLAAVDPAKDVDGFTPLNMGKLLLGQPGFVPGTPAGCLRLLQNAGVPLAGRRAVVVGRSAIVGKPMAALLCAQDATVTLCHSKTQDLADICRTADVLVAAVGRAGFITADMVRPGAAVVDVGINRGADGRLHGDVDFEAVRHVAGWLTPVPGGVGPMTRAMMLANTLFAAAMAAGEAPPQV